MSIEIKVISYISTFLKVIEVVIERLLLNMGILTCDSLVSETQILSSLI